MIPKYQLWGALRLPPRSIFVGPTYLSGDCRSSGHSLALPWLLLFAITGVVVSFVDIGLKMIEDRKNPVSLYGAMDYFWYGWVCGCLLLFACVLRV